MPWFAERSGATTRLTGSWLLRPCRDYANHATRTPFCVFLPPSSRFRATDTKKRAPLNGAFLVTGVCGEANALASSASRHPRASSTGSCALFGAFFIGALIGLYFIIASGFVPAKSAAQILNAEAQRTQRKKRWQGCKRCKTTATATEGFQHRNMSFAVPFARSPCIPAILFPLCGLCVSAVKPLFFNPSGQRSGPSA